MNNSLWGTFHLPLHSNNTYMISLDISNNDISGQLPVTIGTLVPNLYKFNMSRNSLQESTPSSFGDMTWLETLDLSHNNLSGEIPVQLGTHCHYLRVLKLSNNSLHGNIFKAYFNLTWLNYLYLDNNHFMGTLPPSLFNATFLGWR